MFCFKCGANVPEQSTVCPQCGAPVQNAAPTPPPATAAAALKPVLPLTSVPSAQAGYDQQPKTEGKATASMIFGILSITCFWILAGIPAIVLGHLAKSSIAKSMGRLKGDGIATAGLIMGYLSTVVGLPAILIIAAIAIPSLLRSKIVANESATASTVRTLNTAEITYSTQYPSKGYAADLATLGPGPTGTCPGTEGTQEHACLIDATLGCAAGTWCTKYGYKFSVTATCGADGVCTDYVIVAVPTQQGSTGTRSYCSTSDAVIRGQTGGAILTPPTVAECQTWNPL